MAFFKLCTIRFMIFNPDCYAHRNMRRLIDYTKVLFLMAFCSSCSSIYMPNVPATPMLKEQGEGYLAAHVNPKGNISASIAVAATDHVAILGNGSFVDQGFDSNNYLKQWLIEGGLGYFTKIGKSKRQVLEVYGGYGLGNALQVDKRATINGYEAVENREMDFNKIFAQINYSSTRKQKISIFGEKKELNYGTAIRLSRVAMDQFQVDGSDSQEEENFFIEPVFYTRLELINGFQLQYTSGFNIGLNNNKYLKAGNAVFTLGISYNF